MKGALQRVADDSSFGQVCTEVGAARFERVRPSGLIAPEARRRLNKSAPGHCPRRKRLLRAATYHDCTTTTALAKRGVLPCTSCPFGNGEPGSANAPKPPRFASPEPTLA